ncbi:hypothetical protein ACHHYP_11956 [Achlya hypogyna]|uniref:Tc1-like transposase DDE domain-containing protein n=1 Tax=Achlya hypogyna TaxID=1202772 RepID=A0A1V9YHV4_ACHHY|nr:hypothetical protein ACHHYP_11956 [Achlya hypogyna]
MAQATLRQQGHPAVSRTIASILGRKTALVQQVWSEFCATNTLRKPCVTGNAQSRPGRLPDTRLVETNIQTFVRERRQRCQRTVAKDVMHHLAAKSLISFDSNDKNSVNATLRAVQLRLNKLGYKRGNKKGTLGMRLAESNRVHRNAYVRRMYPFTRGDSRHRTIVYTDESFVHHHYKRHDDSLYDPNDEQDLQIKEKHKGARFCFIGAIVEGGILDNAKYHKCLPKDTPRFKEKKAVLQAACTRYDIAFTSETKPELWKKLKKYIDDNIEPEIVTLAKEDGHEVLYSPPHHSDLQPIELVWANVKGTIGRAYDENTTVQDVRIRLDAALDGLTSHAIKGCIDKSDDHVAKLYGYIMATEDLPEDDASDDSGSDSSSDSGHDDTCV